MITKRAGGMQDTLVTCSEFSKSTDQEESQLIYWIEPNSTRPIMSVRSFESKSLYGLETLVPSTTGSNTSSVWVTACLGTQLNCRQKCLLVQQGETKLLMVQQVPLPAITQGEKPFIKKEKPDALMQTRTNLAMDCVFKIHEQCRKASQLKKQRTF